MLEKKLDYSDLQATPEDGKIYQLVRGDLLVSPSPSPMHQRVCRRLMQLLMDYFHGRSLGEVFNAPIDLILTQQDVFVPDLVVVDNPTHVTRRGIEAPPLLVVEILSPSNRHFDRDIKSGRYAELGVRHYWIVDPEARSIECYKLEIDVFRPVLDAEGDVTIDHPTWEGLTIDLTGVWNEPGR